MFNFLRRNSVETKSYNSALRSVSNPKTSTSILIDNKGDILSTYNYDAFDEINRNISVNTIINKQNSIVNEATLVVKEKDNLENESTKEEGFLKFLSWIENPNSYPFPRSRNEIFRYILSNSYKKGIFGVIFSFDNQNVFNHIKIPANISLEKNLMNEVKYRVYLRNNLSYIFSYDPKYRNFVFDDGNQKMFLMVGGNFNNDLQDYDPIFRQILPYILLQNYLVDFATSFHQNACFPSQIITLNYNLGNDSLLNSAKLNPTQEKEFNDAVNDMVRQINYSKGSKSTGGIIIPNNPNIKVDIKPLSIPTNAVDNIKYQDFVSQKIYATIDGGSVDAFEGKSEYSNNASAKLQDLYDGSFRLFKSLVINPLNQFMVGLIGVMNKGIVANNYFLDFDISNVRIYQKQFINEDVMLVQNNILKISEARQSLIKTSKRHSFITVSPEEDIFNSELSGNATKPKVENKSIDTTPNEVMIKNAKRALEWRREFDRGGTAVGVARARDISNGKKLSRDTIGRMISYFARHEVDKQAKGFYQGEDGFPSAGRIAWDLWGGDAGESWAKAKLRQFEAD